MTDPRAPGEGDEDLLPARMINEVVYCPRLFWLEHVAADFAENAHTALGRFVHRRVDRPGGAIAPPPGGGDEPWHARSLWLSSHDLGVTAKVDLVEEDAGGVVPVDTKKGRAPEGGGLWPSDEVQLVLQALLLREAGYKCEAVAAYYAQERRRVRVAITDEMEARASAAIEEARAWRASATPPPPLVGSPKCLGCSLNAICQPDEVHALESGSEHTESTPLRRVVPDSDDAQHLVLSSPRSRLGLRQETLVVTVVAEDETEAVQRVPLHKLRAVSIYGWGQVSSAVMHACLDAGVEIFLLSTGGWLKGRLAPLDSAQVHVRRAQHQPASADAPLAIARTLVADKIANVRTLLRRHVGDEAHRPELSRMRQLSSEAESAPSVEALLALEGEAAKRAWQLFSGLLASLDPAFAMAGRNRRPPRDPTNALLGFVYGMLVRDCVHAVAAARMDPCIGVFHTAHHGRPSMALDLMEPFRPLIADSVVLSVVSRAEVKPDGFVRTGQAVAMDDATRRAVIQAYERRLAELITHPRFGYRISYRQVLGVQARLIARVLTGELAQYPGFRTR